jgi:hypothetical protein
VICDTARNGNRDTGILRKRILPGNIQRDRLSSWIQTLKMRKIKAKPVFTRNTEKVATEQLKKGPTYFGCPPGLEMFKRFRQARDRHTYRNGSATDPNAPESFHGQVKHFWKPVINMVPIRHLTWRHGGIQLQNGWRAKIKQKLWEKVRTSQVISSTHLDFTTTHTCTI